MANKIDSKESSPISSNNSFNEEMNQINKQSFEEARSLFEGINQQAVSEIKKRMTASTFTQEEVLIMRADNDGRLYKSPTNVNTSYGCVWENGKKGYFIPFDHKSLGRDFLQPQSGGGYADGKGLRFVQQNKDSDQSSLVLSQSDEIIIAGFGEYVLRCWGEDLHNLFERYTWNKLSVLIKKWKTENFPSIIIFSDQINLLKEIKKIEIDKWEEATISEFFCKVDIEKLNYCMSEFFNWFENTILKGSLKGGDYYIKRIQSGRIICNEGWVNGKVGFFKDFDNDSQFRFIEDHGKARIGRDWTEADRDLPTLASGFIGWLIRRWGTETQIIYSTYLQTQLDAYKSKHRNDADVFKRDLEHEFYNQYKSKEEQFIKASEPIFDFISEQEVNTIKEFIRFYLEYVADVSNPVEIDEYSKEDETGKKKPKFEIDLNFLIEIFNHCSDEIFTCDKLAFFQMVSNADFSQLKIKNISKTKKLIAHIQKYLPKSWYKEAANSRGWEPSDCSGANVEVSNPWMAKLKKIQPKAM